MAKDEDDRIPHYIDDDGMTRPYSEEKLRELRQPRTGTIEDIIKAEEDKVRNSRKNLWGEYKNRKRDHDED